MTTLKELFKLRATAPRLGNPLGKNQDSSLPNSDGTTTIGVDDEANSPKKTTYKTRGLITAGACNGLLSALRPSLISIIDTIKRHQATDKEQQEKHKNEIRKQIAEKEAELQGKDALIKVCQDKISQIQKSIQDIKDEITYVKAHPEEYDADRISKVYVWIGGVLLVFLTIYLFVFYSSASYSAFFKSFSHDDNKLSQAIFDAQALSAAWNMGTTALFFILLIPFVFLGLGFLIHRFQERGGWQGILKSFGVIAITFVFDAILAYEITEKIYEIKRGGAFEELPPYSISLALENINFWVIIFAGFLVYLIWGFVFDFTINAYQSLDKWVLQIQMLNDKLSIAEQQIRTEQEQIHTYNTEKVDITREIDRLKASLDVVFIDRINLANELSNFFDGWLIFVSQHTPEDVSDHKRVYEEIKKEQEIA